MKIIGKLKHKFDITGINKPYEKRQFVAYCETELKDKYRIQPIVFTCYNRNITTLLDSFETGDNIEIEFKLNGREFNNKYFNTLECISITKL